jgi:nucleoside-diphosphate-sugar epimerase
MSVTDEAAAGQLPQQSGATEAPEQNRRLVCLGYGYVARTLARQLLGTGGWSVVGTTRTPEKASALASGPGLNLQVWDGGALASGLLDGADSLLISPGPDDGGCPAYHAAASLVEADRARWRWIGYLSATSVYGDHGGGWVTESSETRAASSRARRRLLAEQQWLAFGESTGIPVTVFRLAGIYGPGRSAIESVRRGTARRIEKPGQVFSRIHADDIAQVLIASLDAPDAGAVFNVADDLPAPPQDVIGYACELLGVTPPPLIPLEAAELSDAARSFYADNKRVDNTLVKSTLGVEWAYPTYREGLRAVLGET